MQPTIRLIIKECSMCKGNGRHIKIVGIFPSTVPCEGCNSTGGLIEQVEPEVEPEIDQKIQQD